MKAIQKIGRGQKSTLAPITIGVGIKKYRLIILLAFTVVFFSCKEQSVRTRMDFNQGWRFLIGTDSLAFAQDYDDSEWRILNLPHDWSIEGEFDKDNTTRHNGGFLPTGIGWYRKSFKLSETEKGKLFFIDFEGVYRNSEVWINGHFLGKRPFGYIGFRYELTPYLHFGDNENIVAVKVDNSQQPNSRWYTGSGIYRNVWLVSTGKAHIDHWGVFVTTPEVSEQNATINVLSMVKHQLEPHSDIEIHSILESPHGTILQTQKSSVNNEANGELFQQKFEIEEPELWSFDTPILYSIKTKIFSDGVLMDNYETFFGIRTFYFDAEKGFFLNGKSIKLKGVNNHHDLGALGAAFNRRAAERQLEILKGMGCNAIRMSHNPPAPELLDLCDQMGFFVMDEAFDVWAKKKMKHDYHDIWNDWHITDLHDMVKRDRNHPSVMMWSIGNEIREQFDSTGLAITSELVAIVKSVDPTRPVTCGLTENIPEKNYIYQSGVLDVLSFNYKHTDYPDLPNRFPGESFIASENMSAFATRGVYNQPSDSIRIWPEAYNVPIKDPNPDYTCSAYDHVHAYWGATHEETWGLVKKLDFISGMFIWSGFDFIGEPEPYNEWPARSSYYGVIDLCGFPKDVYYLYQSEWTNKTMLHLFPHWNWIEGQTVDVWAYYNNADEVELFLNNESMGIRKKEGDMMHVMWRLKYTPGTLKAVAIKNGQVVKEQIINTAGEPAKIELTADRSTITADGYDLSFVTVRIFDIAGNLVPNADNKVTFSVDGAGFIAGTDNGYQASHEPFKPYYRKTFEKKAGNLSVKAEWYSDCTRNAFNGMCLAILQSDGTKGRIQLEAKAEGLESATIELITK